MRWVEVRAAVRAEAVEAVAGKLFELGVQGVSLEPGGGNFQILVSYFPPVEPAGPGREDPRLLELRAFLDKLPAWGLDPGPVRLSARPVEDSEWLDQWKAYFRPARVGRRLLVHPPWAPPDRPDPGVVPVVIDPAQAFGTGTHATTRAALELLEVAVEELASGSGGPPAPQPDSAHPAPALPVRALDLGTGSGILAIAAAKLGVGRVTAVDSDPVAVEAARENARRNGVEDRVEVVEADALAVVAGRPRPPRRPRLVLANLTTDLAAALVRPLARLLPPGGLFVSAGISTGEGAERIAAAARGAGLEETGRREGEGWTAFVFRKPVGGRAGTRSGSAERRAARRRPVRRRAAHCRPVRLRAARRRPRAVFYTLGCKANLYDTAGMMEDLRRAGWEVSAGDARGDTGDARGDTGDARGDTGDTGGDAGGAGGGTGDPSGDARRDGVNLCVVNSCAVTARAEGKSRQLTRRLRRQHPGAIVALVGCYPELRRAEAAAAAGADVVLGTGDRDRLAGLLRERGLPAAGPEAAAAAPVLPGAFAGERTRAVVKVQDGCEQRCTYCVIPYVRGPSRSRPPEEVAREVGRLVEAGFKEVVLTGIHLGAWGLDLEPPGRSLSDLVREVLDVPGLARLRLSSIEPLEVTGALVDLMASDRRVCRHLHLPLQSGSDAVLEKMNRPYTAGEYLAVVERVRARVPLLGLTTDVMVGFPGETDEDFERTLEVVRRARFSRLHVFRFSRRPGTPAADLPGQVPTPVKKARSEELIRLGRHLGRDFRESLIGRTLEVLVERLVAPGEGEGLTDNYVRVRFRGPRARPNEIVPVLLEEAGPDGLVGREVSPSLPRGGRPR